MNEPLPPPASEVVDIEHFALAGVGREIRDRFDTSPRLMRLAGTAAITSFHVFP